MDDLCWVKYRAPGGRGRAKNRRTKSVTRKEVGWKEKEVLFADFRRGGGKAEISYN